MNRATYKDLASFQCVPSHFLFLGALTRYDFILIAVYIPGQLNTPPDAILRNSVYKSAKRRYFQCCLSTEDNLVVLPCSTKCYLFATKHLYIESGFGDPHRCSTQTRTYVKREKLHLETTPPYDP